MGTSLEMLQDNKVGCVEAVEEVEAHDVGEAVDDVADPNRRCAWR